MKAWTVEFDDYIKDEYGTWSQICDPHLLEVYDSNTEEVERYVDKWAGSGVCGVKGCSRESEHYIDGLDINTDFNRLDYIKNKN